MTQVSFNPVEVFQSYFQGRVRFDSAANRELAEQALTGDTVTINGVEVNIRNGVTLEEARAITGEADSIEFDQRAAEGACLTEECSDEMGSAERTTISVAEARNMLGYVQRYAEAHNLSEETVMALYRRGASFERVNLNEVRENRELRANGLAQRFETWRATLPTEQQASATLLDWASASQDVGGLGIREDNPLYANFRAYLAPREGESPRTIEEGVNFLLISAYASRHTPENQGVVLQPLLGERHTPQATTIRYERNYETEEDLLTWLGGETVEASEPEVVAEEPAVVEEAEDSDEAAVAQRQLAERQATWARFLRMCGWRTGDRTSTLPNGMLQATGITVEAFAAGLTAEQWGTVQTWFSAAPRNIELPAFEDMIEGDANAESRVTAEDAGRVMDERVAAALANGATPTLDELGVAIRAAVPGSEQHGQLFALHCAARVAQVPREYQGSATVLLTLMREHPGVRFTIGDRVAFSSPERDGQICVLALSRDGGEPLAVPLPADTDPRVILQAVLQNYGRDQSSNTTDFHAPIRALRFLATPGQLESVASGSTINFDRLEAAARDPRASQAALTTAFGRAVTAPVAQAPVVEDAGEAPPVAAAPLAAEAASGALLSFLRSTGNEGVRVRIGAHELWVADGYLYIQKPDGGEDRIALNETRAQSLALQRAIDDTPAAASNVSALATVADFLDGQTGLGGRTINLLAFMERVRVDNPSSDRARRNLLDQLSPPPAPVKAPAPAPQPEVSAANHREVRALV